MSKELVISSNRHETKVAILEDDVLVEIFFQRANEYSLAGSIHKGRVTRVLPGMQSAFVDLGLERDTFLYVSDFADDHHEDLDKIGDEKPAARPAREQAPYRPPTRPAELAPVEEAEPAAIAEGGPETSAPAVSSPGSGESRPLRDRDRARGRGGRDRGRDRDRGRGGDRGRRRAGSPLPDSKYASADSASDSPAPAAEAAPPPIVSAPYIAPRVAAYFAPERSQPSMILPGETLAKYRRSAGDAL